MRKSKSFIATPPGATIKEQLIDRGMSQKELAARMDMSEKHISKLINGEVMLTPDVALRLEMVLGLPARFWNNLESIYREKLLMVQEENAMEEDIKIAKKFPYKEMEKNRWIQEAKKIEDKVILLRKFFEVSKLTLLYEPLIPGIACRRQAVTEKADYALLVWAQKAKLDARTVSTKAIDIQRLERVLPQIRQMTNLVPEEFCINLCEMLSDCGIALVFLPHIGGSFLHGATFYDKNKIVMGLTVRGKDADKFWFSLFHEIAHVLYGHIGNSGGTTEEEEAEADAFARETLIPQKGLETFTSAGRFDAIAIKDFSCKTGVDAGIVVSRLQKDGYIGYNQCNELKTKYTFVS